MKKILLIAISSLSFYNTAFAWEHWTSNTTITNQSSCDLTDFHPGYGYQANWEWGGGHDSIAAHSSRDGYVLRSQWKGTGFDNDNMAVLYFKCNNKQYAIKALGNRARTTAMYVIFVDPVTTSGTYGLTHDQLKITKVLDKDGGELDHLNDGLMLTSYAGANDSIEDTTMVIEDNK